VVGFEKQHNNTPATTTSEMPSVYFGRVPSGKDRSPKAVDTPNGPLEPTSLNDFKVFIRPKVISRWYATITYFFGHLVAVLSFPTYCYISAFDAGQYANPPVAQIPFGRRPGIAFGLLKGESMPESVAKRLTEASFRSMTYARNTIWLKDDADRSDYLFVDREVLGVNPKSIVPDRYLNLLQFMAYLQLMALTTNVCQLMHRLCHSNYMSSDSIEVAATDSGVKGWHNVLDDIEGPISPGPDDKSPSIASVAEWGTLSLDKKIAEMCIIGGTHETKSPMAFVNRYTSPRPGYLAAGDAGGITTDGKIFKFNEQLSIPNTNIIGDIIGKRFLTCLGSSPEEQFASLHNLKSGLSALRLLPIGSILTHLYFCVDLAIQAQCGCVPFFSFDVYEGCVLMGGADANICIDGVMSDFENLDTLKQEFTRASEHGISIGKIAGLFPEAMKSSVQGVRSMTGLRALCLQLNCNQDHRDRIIQFASNLNFGLSSLVVNPANLKTVFALLANISLIKDTHPISRLTLFSTDPVFVALSCFGEKSCPSWDIVNGTRIPFNTSTPPSVPVEIQTGKFKSKGEISDARWVMTVRTTDLFMGTDEFRRVATAGGYRSVSSVVAKKSGMKVFRHDQMVMFWDELKLAVGYVNPLSKFNEDTVAAGKRKVVEVGAGPAGVTVEKKKMKF
jgi:hypothetical protein